VGEFVPRIVRNMNNNNEHAPPFVGPGGIPIGAALGLTGSETPHVDEVLEELVRGWRILEESATRLKEDSLRHPANSEKRHAAKAAQDDSERFAQKIVDRVRNLAN